jgi:hypothetical protein
MLTAEYVDPANDPSKFFPQVTELTNPVHEWLVRIGGGMARYFPKLEAAGYTVFDLNEFIQLLNSRSVGGANMLREVDAGMPAGHRHFILSAAEKEWHFLAEMAVPLEPEEDRPSRGRSRSSASNAAGGSSGRARHQPVAWELASSSAITAELVREQGSGGWGLVLDHALALACDPGAPPVLEVWVDNLLEDSPAGRAGSIQVGDFIAEVAGQDIRHRNMAGLVKQLGCGEARRLLLTLRRLSPDALQRSRCRPEDEAEHPPVGPQVILDARAAARGVREGPPPAAAAAGAAGGGGGGQGDVPPHTPTSASIIAAVSAPPTVPAGNRSGLSAGYVGGGGGGAASASASSASAPGSRSQSVPGRSSSSSSAVVAASAMRLRKTSAAVASFEIRHIDLRASPAALQEELAGLSGPPSPTTPGGSPRPPRGGLGSHIGLAYDHSTLAYDHSAGAAAPRSPSVAHVYGGGGDGGDGAGGAAVGAAPGDRKPIGEADPQLSDRYAAHGRRKKSALPL